MSSNNVVVLDNGAGLIKAGIGGNLDPTAILPNCLARPLSSKKFLHLSDPNATAAFDLTSAAVRRPLDRGYLINPDLQREIWSNLFSNVLKINPSHSSLLLVEPLFNLPSLQRAADELVFEEFGFESLFVADSPSLVHLYEASRSRPSNGVVSKTQASLVVDCGFSFTHAAPVFQNFTVNYAVKRLDLGGKALTNYLKELVSYRAVNVMDETFIMDDVKEKLCFVSLDVARDLQVARKPGRDNYFRCTYVLPDGVTHTKGFVKDPDEANRCLTSKDGAPKDDMEYPEVTEKAEDRKRVDLTKNEFSLTNERFLVPEMIFRPADLGMNQAGLADIILTGGSSLFPRFAERLIDFSKCRERELRPLVPDDYQVKITTQEDPILGVWRGGSLLASSPDFETMCVTKAEYEELGSARCRRRFFH
ncbi:hypothetical protein RHGRI_000560 [Rhododendron griersonianum]|uniref:Actin-related protein 6 n=1 Tax=Rhododendron griersonianum TaxID=479676 RepID=A0AAV6LHF4_9ERIC|nr:hypothetical protein RHGRI_000560 [Rhododendron griersonianum]